MYAATIAACFITHESLETRNSQSVNQPTHELVGSYRCAAVNMNMQTPAFDRLVTIWLAGLLADWRRTHTIQSVLADKLVIDKQWRLKWQRNRGKWSRESQGALDFSVAIQHYVQCRKVMRISYWHSTLV